MFPTWPSLPEPRTSDERLLYYGGLGAFLGDLALVAGLLVVGTAGHLRLEYQVNDPVPIVPFPVYVFLGCAAVGAAVAVGYDRFGTRSPPGLAAITYGIALVHSSWTAPHPPGVVTALEYVLLAWPLVAIAAVVAGALERSLRTGTDWRDDWPTP